MITSNVVPINPQRHDDLQRERSATRTRMVFVLGAIAVGIGLIVAIGNVAVKTSNVVTRTPKTEITYYTPPVGRNAPGAAPKTTEGWYYLTPPVVKDGAKKPLSAWEVTSAQPSLAACEKFKANLIEYARGQFYETKQGSALGAAGVAMLGQCVKVTDPRLRTGR